MSTPEEVTYNNGEFREWTQETTEVIKFKQDFKDSAEQNQDYRCAYCYLPIGITGWKQVHIDHFVPKSAEIQWSFEVKNLLLACTRCNVELKRNHNPLGQKSSIYEKCDFTMFHPYLDNSKEHFEGGYYSPLIPPMAPKGLTSKGRESIRILDLYSPSLRCLWIEQYVIEARRNRWPEEEYIDSENEERTLFSEREDNRKKVRLAQRMEKILREISNSDYS